MNKLLPCLVALTIGAISTQTLAQQTQHSQFYAGFDVGAATLKTNAQDVANSLVAQVGGSATVVQDTTVGVGRFFGGLTINENLALELGYNQSGSFGTRFNGVSSGAVAYAGSISAKISGFDYAVLVRPNISSGWNNLFFRFGGHSFDINRDFTVSSGNVSLRSSDKLSGSGILYGIGYDFNVSKGIDVRVGYTAMQKVGGVTDADTNVVTVGLIGRF